MIDFEKLKKDSEILSYIEAADRHLEKLGYTEHGIRHSNFVASTAGRILKELGHNNRTVFQAQVAGLLHDIGNVIHREHHAQTGAALAHNLLLKKGVPLDEVLEITMAIGNHHEEEGIPVSPVCAALVIADKADVHRSRVRRKHDIRNDIHDRVNYSAKKSEVIVLSKLRRNGKIRFDIEIDTNISPVFEYFEIFMSRMLIASKAARSLNQEFELIINGTKML